MEQKLFLFLSETNGLASYGVVLGVLVICGLGIPFPEDISLIFGGFLVYEGKARLLPMMLTGYIGILIGDSIVYALGRRFGKHVATTPGGLIGRIITPAKQAKVQQLFANHGEKIVLLARFLPGVRAVTYFTAGSVRMKYSHFVFFDSVAALASAPVFVFIGYKFGGELERLVGEIRRGQQWVVVAIVVAIVAYVVWRWRKRKLEERALAVKPVPASDSSGIRTTVADEPSGRS